jgi:glucosamine kinase
MLLIADSGSSVTRWRVIKDNQIVADFSSIGLNPFFVTREEIIAELKECFPKKINPVQINYLCFYGAGCRNETERKKIISALETFFRNAIIMIESDLLAAARASFKNIEGIVAILGTGANAGLYDGEKIISTIQSLGYILGDECSGAYFGKKLLTAFLRHQLPEDLYNAFIDKYDYPDEFIIQHVYSRPKPNTFLSSFMPFIIEHQKHAFIDAIIVKGVTEYINYSIIPLNNLAPLPISIVGSVGWFLKDTIAEISIDHGLIIDKFIQEPIDELADFHIKYKSTANFLSN